MVAQVVLARDLKRVLKAAGAPRPATVGLILTGDEELAELNEGVMGRAGPTDVLAFPLLPPNAFPPHPGRDAAAPLVTDSEELVFALPPGQRMHLGEIVVSVERAVAQAEEGRGGQTGDVRWSAADELRLLVTHGALHLCGWDHAEPEEEAAMHALERDLLGWDRPTLTEWPSGASAHRDRSSTPVAVVCDGSWRSEGFDVPRTPPTERGDSPE